MIPQQKKQYDATRCSIKKLCDLVTSYAYPYEDMAELIEDKSYEECLAGNGQEVIEELQKVCTFFEEMENKNEENTRDLADVYLLIGEFCQVMERFSPDSQI